MRLTLQTFLSLDGVMQAPGGPDEDTSSGFTRGGWSYHYGDEEGEAAITEWFENADAFLLGRKTYDIFAGYWPKVTDPDNPIASKLNALPKYVASRTLDRVDWAHTSLLGGDVVSDVAKLKEQPGGELQIHGSGDLARTLIAHDLIDEYRLFYFPVTVGGNGKRLFADDTPDRALRLVSSRVTKGGTVIAAYVPGGPLQYGDYGVEPA